MLFLLHDPQERALVDRRRTVREEIGVAGQRFEVGAVHGRIRGEQQIGAVRAVGGMEQIVDPKDQDYALWQHLLPDAQFDMLLETPEMLRTPIVRNGQKATVGEAAAVWKQWIAEET